MNDTAENIYSGLLLCVPMGDGSFKAAIATSRCPYRGSFASHNDLCEFLKYYGIEGVPEKNEVSVVPLLYSA